MNWQEIGRTWLAELGENIPDAEPEEQWEDWPEAQPPARTRVDAGRIRFGRIGFGMPWKSLAVAALLVIAIGVQQGEPVEPQGGHCLPLLPPLHHHGITSRPLAQHVALHRACA